MPVLALCFQPAPNPDSAPFLWVSPDGIHLERVPGTSAAPVPLPFPGVPSLAIFGEGEAGPRFLLVAEEDAWRACTEDGRSFLSRERLQGPVAGAVYGAGRFVVAGTGGWIDSSHDAQLWIHAPPLRGPVQSLLWSGQRFFLSSDTRAWTSPDGIEWTPLAPPVPAPLKFVHENDSENLWIAGRVSQTWSSADGLRWTPSPEPLPVEVEWVVDIRPVAPAP
jgi:hypothetical protein